MSKTSQDQAIVVRSAAAVIKRCMPMLHNPKHERFCQTVVRGVAEGLSQAQIYRMAGYKAEGHAAAMAASRLMKKDDIRSRIAELKAPAVKKTQITVEVLLNKLEANIVGAEAKGQHGAVNGSIGLMAQLRGLLIDRHEITEVGPFDRCESIPDVVRLMLEDQTPAEALELIGILAQEIERQVADHATLVEVEPARQQAIGSEAERSRRYLRPRRRRR